MVENRNLPIIDRIKRRGPGKMIEHGISWTGIYGVIQLLGAMENPPIDLGGGGVSQQAFDTHIEVAEAESEKIRAIQDKTYRLVLEGTLSAKNGELQRKREEKDRLISQGLTTFMLDGEIETLETRCQKLQADLDEL